MVRECGGEGVWWGSVVRNKLTVMESPRAATMPMSLGVNRWAVGRKNKR